MKENRVSGSFRAVNWVVIFCFCLASFPALGEKKTTPPFPSFNVIVPTVAGHPEAENRMGTLHGETHYVTLPGVKSLFDRLAPGLPKVPAGESVELSFYISPTWSTDEQTRFVELMKRSLQPRFPDNPLKVELHHPNVPRRLRAQMPRPGADDILLALKHLEDTAPNPSDKKVLEAVRHDVEMTQPVMVETDDEGDEFPRRLQRPESARKIVSVFAAIRALVTGGAFYHALHYPEFNSTVKSMWAWSIIIGRASIDFGTSAFAQQFGDLLAKHRLAREPLNRNSFWSRLDYWYSGDASAKHAERAELIKHGVYNYILFTLLLCPFTQWAASHVNEGEPMNWAYFGWTAALCLVTTVIFVYGAKGLRQLRQLGIQSGADIDKKYGALSLVGAISDVANAIPSLGIVRYFSMAFTSVVQASDARRAARLKPRLNRYVFIDSSLPDSVRTRSIVPLENIDDTRRFGRELPGSSVTHSEGEVENFVYWLLREMPRLPSTPSLLCPDAILEQEAVEEDRFASLQLRRR